MKPSIVRITFAIGLLVVMSGCATQPGKSSSGWDPFCMLAGAAVGGGGAAAISMAAGPIGAGIFVGGLLGNLACHQGDPPPPPVAAAPPPAPPPPAPELDSDGDGVIDRLDRCPGTPRGTKVDANGCPDILMTLTGINFKFDSSKIEANSEDILDRAVRELNNASTVDVVIVGHTDSIGSDEYNHKLSHRRANAVRDYLVSHGISASRLSIEGRGESQPVASNNTDEGRYQNRRVELHVAGSGSLSSSGSTHSDSNKAAENWNNPGGPDDAPVAPGSDTENNQAGKNWNNPY